MTELLNYIYTKLAVFGTSVVGKNAKGESGPFYGVAPEGTPFDYTVFTVTPAGKLIAGLDGITSYVGPSLVSIDCYCAGGNAGIRALSNAESICHVFDKIVKQSIGSDYVIQFDRQSEPRLVPEPTESGNERVYHASVSFKVLVHREF